MKGGHSILGGSNAANKSDRNEAAPTRSEGFNKKRVMLAGVQKGFNKCLDLEEVLHSTLNKVE